MTILTGASDSIKTFYDYEAHRLSRVVTSKLCHIELTDKITTIQGVDRLCKLDDEAFKLMSDLQTNRRK